MMIDVKGLLILGLIIFAILAIPFALGKWVF